MMERRAATVQAAENRLRIERDEKAEALAYLGVAQDALEQSSARRYYANVVLDAILSSYIQLAEQSGIAAEAKLAIPDELPADAAELSTVFANALENAIRACQKLPREQRHIRCTCVSTPQFIFEIANPCLDPVPFDEEGLPLPGASGHGTGTRSIVAFAEKNNAVCRFRQENGWFRMQMIL